MREQWGSGSEGQSGSERQSGGERQSAGQSQPLARDQELEREVRRRVHDDPDLQMHLFQVKVTDGKVTLSGQLPSAGLRQRAEALAAGVRGVREVINNIVVADAPA